jgi:outer membrane scaffolding protein for murein synthesis (MipA/OmpV family)
MLLAGAAAAQQLPLWEGGVGVGVIDFPDYRGSDERQNYVLPIPYFIYRGDILKVDRQRIRGLFLKSRYAELDVSVTAVPVRTDGNAARRGMPDLDPLFQLGPAVNVHLVNTRRVKLDLRMPIRVAFATDFTGIEFVGWTFEPVLNLDFPNMGPGGGWNLGLAAGPVWSNGAFNDYFYQVQPRFATAGRPAFDAEPGYSGSQFVAALSKRFPRFWVGAFARYEVLNGATFEDSPLVRSKDAFTAGAAIAWVIGQSKKTVEAYE